MCICFSVEGVRILLATWYVVYRLGCFDVYLCCGLIGFAGEDVLLFV